VGYVALRVEDVAQNAGVNKTTIYRRWPTKADLVSATLRREGEACEGAPDTGSVREDLLIMLRRLVDHGRSPMVRVMMPEMTHPEVRAIANGLKHNFESEWVSVVARGVGRGELPAGTSPLLVTEIVTSAVIRRLIRGEEMPDEAFCESVVDLVLAGSVALAARRPRAKTG